MRIKLFVKISIFMPVYLCFIFMNSYGESTSIWLHIHATQPYVTANSPEVEAIIPLEIFQRVIQILPEKYKAKSSEMGFQLDQINAGLANLSPGEEFKHLSEGTLLVARITPRPSPQKASHVVMFLDQPSIAVRFPLSTNRLIVQFLTRQFADLRGMEKELSQLIQSVQNLPPGEYLSATNGFRRFRVELQS